MHKSDILIEKNPRSLEFSKCAYKYPVVFGIWNQASFEFSLKKNTYLLQTK